MKHNKIAVLDFGGQYAHLIANRVRRLGVYSEILDNDIPASRLREYKGVILSGGPDSVNDPNAPKCDPKIFSLPIPILAICYGHQLMQHMTGGRVAKGKTKEYGFATLHVKKAEGIFKDFPKSSRVWMSHFDMVREMADGFETIGETEDCPTAAIADFKKNHYGIQFHMEVTHTEEGQRLLDNFLNICGVRRDWNIKQFIKDEIEVIKKKIGDKKVFLLVSGGVDSTVCFALLEKALGPNRVYGMLVDTGLMRFQEAEKVRKTLAGAGFTNLHVADKKDLFLSRLKGVSDPEKKRKIIGDLFWEVKEDVAEELGLNPDEWIMGQGTIYPDTIETGGTRHADKIKTHHNRVDLMQEMIRAGKVIEPISELYKDEVRELGEELGLPHELVWRHPFPGPGLGVRILCTGKKEVAAAHARTSAVYELSEKITKFIRDKFNLGITAKVLPCKSVGVQGDERTYRHPVALFTDLRDWEVLEKISTSVTNNFSEVNRVILTLHGEAGDFRLKLADTSADRVTALQKVDDAVTKIMAEAPEDYGIWQFPVVLVPVSTKPDHESIVFRPIVSTEAMTASFAKIDSATLQKLTAASSSESSISHIFYDLTHKPPGTIEWE
ncbi:glutamine-hydrolyzing GMP synthase [Patescibacteria group bacterium]|nr:glutamine-hydrolyzing GMP synthase [Patescibacteria group bacterium]MBU1015710.1 glutamine-hydrolyzing GMP synthase [Patescibacteria group bacterium]MBU1684882.1 glutamine-hydrolyzing GMP synthase [Patescibacteria group bacterium]MBU1938660.1 glutamine-hydrolyzing GMP synthase [Patescibacteria group bacterium]